ncbi:MAG: sigma 54-interacting transcriptional regulator [Amaricoccus sp.]|uniref:sigma 54-interacting transcriptional regulator n=1 Tax=Amaricoccus sp. TaxID=1872485 RepID=UPI0039E2A10F
MRVEIAFSDRVGIASEILTVLARHHLDVLSVEVEPPHIFINSPDLTDLEPIRPDLERVAGVRTLRPVDLLPGARRRLHLDALLNAFADPVLAVDARGHILVANAAAASLDAGTELAATFDDPAVATALLASGFRDQPGEATVHGEPFMLEARPLPDGAGGMVLFHAPQRLGERMNALQHLGDVGFDALLGAAPRMRALKQRAARVAAVDGPLLILGETGTGKELLAHACHRASPRAEMPFLALNCAALPESLAESELFGYAGGAFSGARRDGKPGLLELADRGTVFLDEIGEMSLYLQAKLLRFLSDGSFRRVGAARETRVDVRIISATHRDLPAMIGGGDFREDLYYRLNVLTLEIPALRDRGDDVVLLARHFCARAAAQTGSPACRLSAAAEAALAANPWPGNVRQLENAIFRAVTLADHPTLAPADLELAAGEPAPAPEGASWAEAVASFERAFLGRLYPDYPSSRKLAARLGTSHTMIANKLREHGLTGGPPRPR